MTTPNATNLIEAAWSQYQYALSMRDTATLEYNASRFSKRRQRLKYDFQLWDSRAKERLEYIRMLGLHEGQRFYSAAEQNKNKTQKEQ